MQPADGHSRARSFPPGAALRVGICRAERPPRLARFAGCPRDVTPGPASREPVLLCWPPWRPCSCVLPGAPLAFPLGAGPPGSPLSAPAPPSTGPPPLLSGPCTWFRPRLGGRSSSLDCLGGSLGFTAAGMVVAGPEPCISACELLPSPEASSPCALLLAAHELFSDICSMCLRVGLLNSSKVSS